MATVPSKQKCVKESVLREKVTKGGGVGGNSSVSQGCLESGEGEWGEE